MASAAYLDYLEVLLQDAEELSQAHRQLRTGAPGRQWRLGALNRAVVVMCVSAWEAYVEEVAKETVEAIRPNALPLGSWPALAASVRAQAGRFHTPNSQNVRALIRDAVGLADVTVYWYWRNNDAAKARARLDEMLRFRHQVAHGVNPRPTIHNNYCRQLPGLVRSLAECTDYGLGEHLRDNLHVVVQW
jgi:RiboL-PSP-HEPN